MTAEKRLYIAVDDKGNLALGGPWALAEIKGNAAITAATATATASKVIDGNTKRKALMFYNNSSTDAVYLGTDTTVTTANGWPLPPGAVFMDLITNNAWYAICASGKTIDLRMIEAVYS